MSISTLITRQRLIAVKIEAAAGTAEVLNATYAGTIAFNPKMSFDVALTKRPSPATASQYAALPGAEKATTTFTTHLHGLGSAGNPLWAAWMTACGLTNTSGVFTPVTDPSGAKTTTIGFYQSGRFKSSVGSAGSFIWKAKVGEPVSVDWTWTGLRGAPTTASLLAPAYATTKPPVLLGSTITLGGTQYKLSEFQFASGGKVALVEDAGSATGYVYALVTDREPKLTGVKVMATTAKDFHADHVAGTEFAWSAQIGSATNNTITLAAPKAQLEQAPEDDDKDGYMVDSLGFQLNKSADAGDDEYSITFT